jgi:SAM-dependent methyltransferase
MRELLIGAGSNRDRKLTIPGLKLGDWQELVTLDINPAHKPDVVWNLERLPLPFEEDTFDTVSAFEVMEHVGRQGDWRFFFDQWSDLWRIMRPGGLFFGTSPDRSSRWAWGDPGHTRIIGPEALTFLHQPAYAQVGHTPMTDYRFYYQADFDLLYSNVTEHGTFEYVLRAVKPSRISHGD